MRGLLEGRTGGAAAVVAMAVALLALAADEIGIGGRAGLGPQQVAAVVAGLAGALLLAYRRWGDPALAVALVLSLAAATVFVQYRGLNLAGQPQWSPDTIVTHWDLPVHRSVLDGAARDPWNYRLLSEWGAELFYDGARELGSDRPEKTGFLAFRVLQNLVILSLAWLLLRRLGLARSAAALGLGLIAWAMTQAVHDAGLSFNTYTDVAAYLAAGLLVLDRRWAWLVPLTALAALNRETSGLIPLMAFAVAAVDGLRTPAGRRGAIHAAAALAAFVVVIAAVRIGRGPVDLIEVHGQSPGKGLFYFNLEQEVTWEMLFRTLNVVPFVALAGLARWPRELRAIGLAVIPVWIVAHAFGSVWAESRLFLAPYALVLVPGAMLAVAARSDQPIGGREAL
ncbi:MAG TPA: hypothetical protein VF712_19680 [Thermoleophilaceae bacterium]|jgi:hypothetical protein